MIGFDGTENIVGLTLYLTILNFTNLEKIGLVKTLWEMEKLLVLGIYSFFHNDFYPFIEIQWNLVSSNADDP